MLVISLTHTSTQGLQILSFTVSKWICIVQDFNSRGPCARLRSLQHWNKAPSRAFYNKCFNTAIQTSFPTLQLWREVSIRVQRDESGNAYSAWQLRQSFGHNLQIRQSSLGDHQATRVHPLQIVHEIKNYWSMPQTSNRRTYDKCDLELANTIPDRDEFAGTPYKAVHCNGAHRVFQCFHICLVIPRLNLKGDNRLGARVKLIK